jgi:hypothetical protein
MTMSQALRIPPAPRVSAEVEHYRPQPMAFGEIERLAISIAKSGLFGMKTPDQAMALMMIAQAEGMHPALAARDYDVIQGRPAKKSEAMLRDFLGAGGKVEWHGLDDTIADATFSHPQGGMVRITWDMKRAQAAGLGGKDNWKKFPRQMLRSRTVSEGVRTVWPTATGGMYVPEEAQDAEPFRGPTIDHEPAQRAGATVESTPPPESKPAAAPTNGNGHKRKVSEVLADIADAAAQASTPDEVADLERRDDVRAIRCFPKGHGAIAELDAILAEHMARTQAASDDAAEAAVPDLWPDDAPTPPDPDRARYQAKADEILGMDTLQAVERAMSAMVVTALLVEADKMRRPELAALIIDAAEARRQELRAGA